MHRELTTAARPAQALIDASSALGGRDNASAVVIDWSAVRREPPPVPRLGTPPLVHQ
jgi:serine/threonine protein phosphatase PrpC